MDDFGEGGETFFKGFRRVFDVVWWQMQGDIRLVRKGVEDLVNIGRGCA